MRYSIQLFVVHPASAPEEIGERLGLAAKFQQMVGERRQTPTGDLLPGHYPDTRWRYAESHDTPDGHFADKLSSCVGIIEQRRTEIQHLLGSGGNVTVILAFMGDGAYGDVLPPDLLRRLADCGVQLGIEVYSTPQD